MAERDFYEVLGVSRDVEASGIKSAYRRLARKYHPDVNKAPNAAEKFKEATEAYEVLSDPQKRKMYDQYGRSAVGGGGRPDAYRWAGPGAEGVSFSVEDIFGHGGNDFLRMSLDEILQSLGGRGRRRKAPGRASRGGDIETEMTLDFIQATRGMTATLRLQGEGGTETIDVKIPPGVQEGSRVRLRGKGSPAPGGSGDLYIVTHVRDHPYFRRVGRDIYVDLPVSVAEAAAGAKVDVPTIDGMMTVKIPPCTSSGTKLRLRGKGVGAPGSDKRGDQYVVVKIVVPPKIKPQALKLLKDFDKAQPFDPRKDVPWK